MPPGDDLGDRFTRQIAWIRARYEAGAIVASACSGAVLLAEGGLLDGQDATTHWAYCDALQTKYPTIRVHPERALVLSGEGQRLVMAGAGTSWQDLALYLIGRFAGVDAAMHVARMNLIDWHRVGQQPFARLARTRQVWSASSPAARVRIAEHFREPSPVAAMIRLSGIAEPRSSDGSAPRPGCPARSVHMLRLEAAKELLEGDNRPAETVAFEVGYEDAAFFRRLFRRHVHRRRRSIGSGSGRCERR